MAAKLTTILYASVANLAALTESLAASRKSRPIRLIALEEFRGETESNAGAVYIKVPDEPGDNFRTLVDAIAQAYPHLDIQKYEDGDLDEAEPNPAFQMKAVDDTLRDLRLTLINAGGSAPANATAAELADLIAEQRATQGLGSRTPVLPTPATQGTTIPDSTPVAQKIGADALVSPSATGTSQGALDKAIETAGEGSGQTAPGTYSPAQTPLADLSKVNTHEEADAAAKAEGVDLSGVTKVADKVKAIQAARDGKAQG